MSFVGAGLLEGVYFEDTNFGYIRSSPFSVPSIGKYTIALRLKDNSKFCGWLLAKIDWMNDDSPDYGGGYNPETVEISYNYYPFRLFINASMGLTADDILSGTIEMGDNVKPPPIYKPYTGEVDSIAGRLAVIADNTPEVSEKIASSRATSSGEVITATDICDIEHAVDVRLSSKNLINLEGREVVNFGNSSNTTKRVFPGGKGIILGLTPNNYYNGGGANPVYEITKNSMSYFMITGSYGLGVDIKLKPNTQYAFSYGERNFTSTDIRLMEFDVDGNYIGYKSLITNKTITTNSNTDWGVLQMGGVANTTLSVNNIQLEEGTTASPYEPFGAYTVGTKVTVRGTNLFDMSKVPNGIYTTVNEDGTITISGKYYESTYKTLREFCPELKAGDVITFNINTTGFAYINLAGAGVGWTNKRSYTITEEILNSQVLLYGLSDNGTYTISQIWVNYGTTTSPYEPYVKPTTYTSNSDGIVEGVKSIYPTMVISTDTPGTLITCTYFSDGNVYGKFIELGKAFEAAKALI